MIFARFNLVIFYQQPDKCDVFHYDVVDVTLNRYMIEKLNQQEAFGNKDINEGSMFFSMLGNSVRMK